MPQWTDDPEILRRLANAKMPFGKFQGRAILDLPEHYLVWFAGQGFPKGELGRMMGIAYELKLNGLHELAEGLRKLATR